MTPGFPQRSRPRVAPLLALITALVCAGAAVPAVAQVTPLDFDRGAIGLGLALRHLGVDGSVLYVTAHPDDERNGVLVKMSRGLGLRTALLTTTRGDGGQNEIGPELFQAIGILRSEELAGVHRYDGVEQYFTRAYEFGYSFSVEETFDKWGKEEILRDVVRVVRRVRPDVILTMPREGPGGGQHHQASARLAHEAFRAAADPGRFPEQIAEGLRPWQARKVYQSSGGFFGDPAEGSVIVDTSTWDPLLAMTWHQFGTLARRAHRCQGMGQLRAWPGEGSEGFALVDAEPAVPGTEDDVLAGVDLSLRRWLSLFGDAHRDAPFLEPAIERVERSAAEARAAWSATAPWDTLEPLAAGLTALRELRAAVTGSALEDPARAEILDRISREEGDFAEALTLAQGLELDVTVDDGDVTRGQTFRAEAHVYNASPRPVRVDSLELAVPEGWSATLKEGAVSALEGFASARLAWDVTVGPEARYSQPYWKRNPAVDRYDIEIPEHLTLPWSPPRVVGKLSYTTAGVTGGLETPAYYRYDGPWVGGEKQKVVNVVPALSVEVTPGIAVIPLARAGEAREFRVQVLNDAKGESSANVRLEAPAGWRVEPAEVPLHFSLEGEQGTARFFVTPPPGVGEGDFALNAVAVRNGEEFREGYQVIAYDHIQARHLFHPASTQVKTLDVAVNRDVRVGYVPGAGDEVPPAIRSLGIEPVLLGPDDIAFGDLSPFTTIVTGIRAYQTRPDLKAHHQRLMDYVEAGGNLVVQYNKFEFNQLAERAPGGFGARRRDVVSPFAPWPGAVTSDRITVEETPVAILDADSPLLVAPNRIGEVDFESWVQERGLYFFGAKDERYKELLSAEDPWPKNAGVKHGMLTTTDVGKGTWTYVGLGLWRQLPAGTRGAYRILANLIGQPRGD